MSYSEVVYWFEVCDVVGDARQCAIATKKVILAGAGTGSCRNLIDVF